MRLYGRNPVFERLRVNPQSIRKIYIEFGCKDAGYIYKKAKQRNIPVIAIPSSKIVKIGRNINTQGILTDVDDFFYTPYDELLETAVQKKTSLIFLDALNDPQNLGSIIRCAACLGKFALVIPTHDSVSVTDAVLRVASGGDNYVSAARVNNLSAAIKSAKQADFWIMGAVVKGGQPLAETRLQYPLGLVVGSEQKGIRDVVRTQLDSEVTIPMTVETLSLNVAQAAAILCYEIVKQKKSCFKA